MGSNDVVVLKSIIDVILTLAESDQDKAIEMLKEFREGLDQ